MLLITATGGVVAKKLAVLSMAATLFQKVRPGTQRHAFGVYFGT